MNPHYGEYYRDAKGKTPPADYLNPVPVYFLALEQGTKFEFAVASREQGLAAKATDWLKGALADLGIGAKTSAGYGYFSV
jgi:CRISPR-associated protein Cmr6